MTAETNTPSLWHRVSRFWLAHEPVRHARWEVVLLRVVIALLLWDIHTGWVGYKDQPLEALAQMTTVSRHNNVKYETQEHPNGVAMFVNLTFLSRNSIETPLRLATGVSLLLYAIGVPAAFSLLVPLFFGLGVMTLTNSQGAINHIAQGLHLAMLAIWLASVWALWRRRSGHALPQGFSRAELEFDWARQGIMAGYVASAISKIMLSGGDWLTSSRYVPLHLVKNNDMEYYESLNPDALRLDWLPQLMMEHPALCIFFFGLALPLELFAFLGLRNRRIAVIFGLGLIAFHESVTQLMQLSFIFNKTLLLFLFVSPQWWLAEGIRKWRGGNSPTV